MKHLLALLLLPSVALAQPFIPEATPNPSDYGLIFRQVLTADGADGTGLTISGAECQISVAGGNYANCAGTVDEIGLGDYEYVPAAAEITTPGGLILYVKDSTADAFRTKAQIVPTADGTMQGTPSTTSLRLAAAETYADDELIGAKILIVSASAGAGQTACVTDYVSSTDTATVQTLTTAPTGTVRYKVIPDVNCASAADSGAIADAVWDEAQSGHTTAGTFGKYLDDQVSTVSGGGASCGPYRE